MTDLTRNEEVLAALGLLPNGQATPVQAVKMLFLMERREPAAIGGPKFDFVPYDYGPFDSAVYSELDGLRRAGFVEVLEGRPRRYKLTAEGRSEAARVVERMDADAVGRLREIGKWVGSVSFAQLVSGIYQLYPEMRANSIFTAG